jgi:hypothetical protein
MHPNAVKGLLLGRQQLLMYVARTCCQHHHVQTKHAAPLLMHHQQSSCHQKAGEYLAWPNCQPTFKHQPDSPGQCQVQGNTLPQHAALCEPAQGGLCQLPGS